MCSAQGFQWQKNPWKAINTLSYMPSVVDMHVCLGVYVVNSFSMCYSDKDIRVDVARQRELKWLDMFNNWDKWVSRRFQKVKLRCRKGIPSSLRAKAWQLLSNSKELLDSNPGKFEELEREQGDPKWLDIIEKDLHRQFPFHEMFAARGGHGQQDLYRVLKAYTVYRPEEGYCQAQAPVAAVLLMHMPAEHAFWCLVQICETYLPGYYSEAIQLDGEIFFSLLRRVCPMAYRHLKKFKIDPILYMTEWFMCVFSRTLPWSCVLRVWDMFFCEGVKIVFRVGLVLLKQMLGSVDKLREVQGMYETMERLRNIPPESVREDLLVQEGVQGRTDPPACPKAPRDTGHPRAQASGLRHQLRGAPQGLLQPALPPRLPQVQNPLPFSEDGLLLWGLWDGGHAATEPLSGSFKPTQRPRPQTTHV
uniref:TBC1 domain family, member 10b n=1 Tax=Oncorhynchus mykiss TaxID=8022 RepID=A0A8K9VB80_ONCMY